MSLSETLCFTHATIHNLCRENIEQITKCLVRLNCAVRFSFLVDGMPSLTATNGFIYVELLWRTILVQLQNYYILEYLLHAYCQIFVLSWCAVKGYTTRVLNRNMFREK